MAPPQLQAVVSLNHGPFVSSLGAIQQATQNAVSAMAYGFGGVAGEVMTTVRAFGLLGGAVYAASRFMRETVTVGAEFQQQMANVGSVTGLTKDQLRTLGTEASAIGARFGFLGGEAASALYALGSAGLQTAADLKNVLVPSLLLSGATQAETRMTTEALTATLKTYRLETSEATRIANLFAGAIASSPATMERLSDAMTYAGPAAAALGISLEDTVGTIAAFHQAGLMGQRAGVSFRQVLLELVEAAGKSEGAIAAALAGWKPGAEGITGAIERLSAAGITAEEVIAEFGARAGPAMALLMDQGSAAIDELTNRIIANGDVQKMYARQMDTVQGQWKIFIAVMDQVKQQAFVELAPLIQHVVVAMQNMARIIPPLAANIRDAVVGAFNLIMGTWDAMTPAGKMVTGAFLGFLVIIPVVTSVANSVAAAMRLMLTSMLSFVVPAAAALAALITLVSAFSLGQVVSRVQVGSDTIGGHLTSMFTTLIIRLTGFADQFAVGFKLMMARIKAFVLEKAPEIVEAFSRFLAPIVEKFGDFRAWILEKLGLDEAAAEVRARAAEMAAALREFDSEVALENARAQIKALEREMNEIATRTALDLKNAMELAGDAARDNLADAIQPADILGETLKQIEINGGALWDTIKAGGPAAKEVLAGLWESITDGLPALQQLDADAAGAIDGLVDGFNDAADAAADAAKDVKGVATAAESVRKNSSITQSQVRQFATALKELGALAGMKFPVIPDYNVELSSVTSSRVRQFVDAMRTLATGLQGIQLPKLPDFSKFELPRVRVNDARQLVLALKEMANGLAMIQWPQIPQIKIPTVPAADLANWQKLVNLMKQAAGIKLPELQPIRIDATVSGLDVSGMATEKTLSAILSKISSFTGTYWA